MKVSILSSNNKPKLQLNTKQLQERAKQVVTQGPQAVLNFWNQLSPEQKAIVQNILKTAVTAALLA